MILLDSIITTTPTLTTTSLEAGDENGLYKSTATNSGNPTYYFRGAIDNNYVSFAGFTWRIVRINEDGTIRIVMQDGINNNTNYKFNSSDNNYSYMYYTNSEIKTVLEEWYNVNIGSKPTLASKVATGNYYCEQATVKFDDSAISENATMTTYTNYTPDFKCSSDGNGKGIVNSSIGLLTYDEVVYTGGYRGQNNSNYYLCNNTYFWTMSPAGFGYSNSYVWFVYDSGRINIDSVIEIRTVRPVLNLNANTRATGSGTSSDPYIIRN